MPNLSYQMQLMNAAQERPMRNLNALLNTAGGFFQRSEARTDEMDAVNYFIQKEDISPEDMRDFKTTHPRMPDVDIWKIAGRIGTQKKAQKAKDFVKTIGSLLENGEELNEETIGRAVKNSGLNLAEAMKVIETGAKSGLDFKQAKVKNRFVTIGGRGVLDTETNKIIGAPEPERPYKVGQKIDVTGPDGTEYEGWVGGYDENNQVKFDKLVKKVEKVKTDKVKVYGANGNLVRLATPEPDGIVNLKPGETTQEPRAVNLLTPAEEAQRIRISKASREEGKETKPTESDKLYNDYLKKFIADKAAGKYKGTNVGRPFTRYEFKIWMEKQIAEGRDPLKKILSEAENPAVQTIYKTADEVKAAFKAGKIKEGEAVQILRKNFGMK